MFADRAKIFIRSGKGGDGHVQLPKRTLCTKRRYRTAETADKAEMLIFEVDEGLNTLADYRHREKICCRRRGTGRKTQMSR
ncbi:MAG: hypothetical protein ACLUVD_07035 [Mediterraneibacter faecis]